MKKEFSYQDLINLKAKLEADSVEVEPGFWVAKEMLPEPYDERETNP